MTASARPPFPVGRRHRGLRIAQEHYWTAWLVFATCGIIVLALGAQVLLHYEAFRQEGARVTYKEFDFGHLDFTFAVGSRAQGVGFSMLAAVLHGSRAHAGSECAGEP